MKSTCAQRRCRSQTVLPRRPSPLPLPSAPSLTSLSPAAALTLGSQRPQCLQVGPLFLGRGGERSSDSNSSPSTLIGYPASPADKPSVPMCDNCASCFVKRRCIPVSPGEPGLLQGGTAIHPSAVCPSTVSASVSLSVGSTRVVNV